MASRKYSTYSKEVKDNESRSGERQICQRHLEENVSTAKCEATSLFDQDVHLLLVERVAESKKWLEYHQERLAETTSKEEEAGRIRDLKVEELKYAEEQSQKLEKAMLAVAQKDKTRAKQVLGTLDRKMETSLHRNALGRQSHWRQLLIESNKQAKLIRINATVELRKADAELKLRNREKTAETQKLRLEEWTQEQLTKKNLLEKYREARAFQRILEKEEEAKLKSQLEREEFFAEKKAGKARKLFMETEDKLVEDWKCQEMRQKLEKAERNLKIQVRKNELKAQAEEKHRQLWEIYQQAEANLDDCEKELDRLKLDKRKETFRGTSSLHIEMEMEGRRNFFHRFLAIIWNFFRTYFQSCTASSA